MYHQSHTISNKVINGDKDDINKSENVDDKDKSKQNAVTKVDYDEYDDYAEPVTTGQKVIHIYGIIVITSFNIILMYRSTYILWYSCD